MFTFTKKTEYALLALSYLAQQGAGRVVGPREIAQHHEIPAELLAKVLQTLARHHLANSVPGPTGGYRLARTAHEITVANIVCAMDGPVSVAPCAADNSADDCAQSRTCHLHEPLARIQEGIENLLNAMTLADVCGPGERSFSTGQQLPMLEMGSAVVGTK